MLERFFAAWHSLCAGNILPRLTLPFPPASTPPKPVQTRTRVALFASLLLILSVVCMASSQASLRVREYVPHAEQWFRLYNELPDVWKTRRDIKLRELPPREMERLIARLEGDEADRNDDSVVDGCYQSGDEDDDTPIITLCDSLRGEQAGLVFTHEYGHFVWGEMLTNRERTRYTQIWRSQKRAHRLVTEYAGDSDEEGFAEAFAYYLRKPAQLQKKDSASSQFFHDLLASRTSESTSLMRQEDEH